MIFNASSDFSSPSMISSHALARYQRGDGENCRWVVDRDANGAREIFLRDLDEGFA
jgi:hypothetical protein